jgi:type IX secretion system PorP/SprF family membrane protein
MKKALKILTLSVATASIANAQQDAQFSQNMFNRVGTNPGAAGSNNSTCFTLLGRQQWTGFTGAPKTVLASADMPVLQGSPLHGGAGITIVADKQGFESNISGKLAYSYHLPIEKGKLGIGIELGAVNYGLNGTWIAPDGTNGITDPSIPQSKLTKTVLDAGLGLYYTSDKLYAGLSAAHLPASKIKSKDVGSKVTYDIARHYYITAGYNWAVTPTITLRPNIFIKTDAASTQIDGNVNALFNNLFWAGVSYRTTDAIVAMLGVQMKGLKIGYSYDYTTSNLKKSKGGASSGSHEIYLGYCLKQPDKTSVQRSRSVRFL